MATFDETDDFLEHHGVLGMHWGKRKAKSSNNSNSKKGSTAPHDSYVKGKAKTAVILGSVAAGLTLAAIAQRRYANGADARAFKKLAPELIRRVSNVHIVNL